MDLIASERTHQPETCKCGQQWAQLLPSGARATCGRAVSAIARGSSGLGQAPPRDQLVAVTRDANSKNHAHPPWHLPLSLPPLSLPTSAPIS
ncbi:hypothetical protein AAFF_G00113080 [Aldrovandia affinis]|uniref:Uncharacterized protein n=1 Tax=Aldrovandia affinis TaxID=143900 RepID=A0AAD7RT15_9TELE|nr:hypothetical protein AAFF_G00113080 [Aldrovandia affinis]